MSTLTAIFGSSDDKSQDSEKLLQLYWNRAELKKEFAGMRKEQFRLQDKIKQEEGSSARLQQKLDHLEDLLVDPQWVHNVTVFYQLRNLAVRCESKLAKFAEQLKQQREQKQHNSILVKWNEERTAEARAVEQEMLIKRDTVQQLEDELQSERQRLMNMSGFLKIFRRRSVTSILDNLAAQIDLTRQDEAELAQSIEEIRNRKAPDNSGLDIASKRSINLMILSFAQQLYVQFGDDDLAALAKESREKSVGAVNYGSRDECDRFLDRINQRMELIDKATDFAELLQKRAKLLSTKVLFRQDTDVVPISSSVATLYTIDSNETVRESDVNILGDNYWAIGAALSR